MLKEILLGKAWTFGSHISTDQILPGRYLDLPDECVGEYAMAGVDEGFTCKISPGDFIVAGANFGCGSSREAAPVAIKLGGIGAVIAESFGRIFFRNAINIGLPAVIIESVAGIQQGDDLEIDLGTRRVENLTQKNVYPILNLSGIPLDILRHGGIVDYTLARVQGKA